MARKALRGCAVNDFLNPKSMLTPGAAGAFLMFLVNGVCFSFPELAPRYVALGLSFVIGLVSFAAVDVKPVLRATLWVLNSLIIFTMGMGAAKVASVASGPQQTAATPPALGLVLDLLVAPAQAQEPPHPDVPAAMPAAAASADPEVRRLLEAQRRQIEALQQQNQQLAQAQAAAPPAPARAAQANKFFKDW
jgi:hypothetical protein